MNPRIGPRKIGQQHQACAGGQHCAGRQLKPEGLQRIIAHHPAGKIDRHGSGIVEFNEVRMRGTVRIGRRSRPACLTRLATIGGPVAGQYFLAKGLAKLRRKYNIAAAGPRRPAQKPRPINKRP